MKKINFISLEDTIQIHKLLMEEYGGISGIRDKNLLESAIMQPQMTLLVNMHVRV